jgi:protocatechuate 3,4-dioxygenase beta subunit
MKVVLPTLAVLTAACVASVVLGASPQVRDMATAPIAGTAQISGRVVTGEATATPAPVRRVTMTLTGDRTAVRAVAVTDDDGQFAFRNLPADRYSLSAAKASYLPWNYGSKRPGGSGTPIVLADGQRAAIAMTLTKGSVLTGTVRDERGAPIPGVTVAALRYAVSSQTGERELQAVTVGSQLLFAGYAADAFPGTAATDDRGVYRIFGLAPGDYIVSAAVRPAIAGASNPRARTDIHQVTRADVQRAQQLIRDAGALAVVTTAAPAGPSDASRVNYASVYYPGAIAAVDATTITLGRSEERSGIDIVVRLVPTATLTGVVTQPNGEPVPNASLNLHGVGPSASGYGGFVRLARSGADGTFSIPGLDPGPYELFGYTYPEGHSAATTVEIAGRDLSTSLVLEPGGTISGRIVLDGASKPPAPNAALVLLQGQKLPGAMKYDVAPDGTFVISNIPPSKLRIRGRPPAGWLMRSAIVKGVDALDIAFEISAGETIDGAVVTLTDRGAEVSGRFIDAAGTPAPDYVLLVFSADRRLWAPRSLRTQVVRPDAKGTFVARDLPAGDYLISAVTDLEDGQWNDPTFLALLAAGSPIRITLAEGEKKVQDIRVGGAPSGK